MAKKKTPKKKDTRLFLWFTSFCGGDHCNTISKNASDIAREMVEKMEDSLGKIESVEGETNGERILNIFDAINQLKPKWSEDTAYFSFGDGSWSSVSLANDDSINNARIVLKA